MNAVMSGYIDDFVLVYLDDILVYSDNAKEHEAYLRQVFDRLRKHKLQAKLKKCEFGKPYVKYLGHVVGSGELRGLGQGGCRFGMGATEGHKGCIIVLRLC